MNHVLTAEEIEFNRGLDPHTLLERMGFAEGAAVDDGPSIRVYCPIHKDQVIRSLVIEKEGNRFRCLYKSCPAHRGGLLIELFALYLGVEVPEAISQLRGDERPGRALIERADREIEAGHLDEAMRLLEEAVRLAPRDEVARCKLAALYLETGQRDKGFKEYLAAAEDFAVKNQVEKTLSIYNILVMLSPEDVRVHRQMAYLFSRLGRAKEAAEHLKWVTEHLIGEGKIAEAIKTVREILTLIGQEGSIHLLLARLLVQDRKVLDAVAEAEQAAELALEEGDFKLADEAVTFGLMYRPDNEHLRSLEQRIRENEAAAPSGAAAGQQDDDFGQWLGSLEAEVFEDKQADESAGGPPSQQLPPEGAPSEAWLSYCRDSLSRLDDAKLEAMGRRLESMLEEVEASFKSGHLSEWEMNVLRNFYNSFQEAYKQVQQRRWPPGGGRPPSAGDSNPS